ncbi:hypothetical protein Hamer_G012744 [Homarus americanus]|uniref:Uncharacterized protein n=1 Tax=Homarus americanus TaxID=6706 RepID=A0A8J5JM68_HOMAM|nr:hypothetical protein Hamer_G012744 [Homarus americanus]
MLTTVGFFDRVWGEGDVCPYAKIAPVGYIKEESWKLETLPSSGLVHRLTSAKVRDAQV